MTGIGRSDGSAGPQGGQGYGGPGYGQPGYGQPPTPGQPPAYGQPPGYGQPPAYGQPAPRYGYQGQPPNWTPPPQRGRSKLPLILSVAAVVVLVAAAAGIGLALRGGGSGGGTSSAPKGSDSAPATLAAWQATQAQYDALSTLTDGSDLVVTADTGVYAYSRTSGKLAWTLKPPAFGSAPGAFCGSGQHAVGGKLSVGFGKLTDPEHHTVDCSSVGVVDLRSGKLLWTSLMIPAGEASPTAGSADGMTTEISGTTVLATWQGAGAAFSLTTGHRLWLQDFHVFGFEDLAAANGVFYGLLLNVDPFPDQFAMAVDVIDPATGHVVSQRTLTGAMTHTGQPQTGAIVSTKPLTLFIEDEGDNNDASFVVLNSAGTKVTRVIPAGAQNPDAPASSHVLFAVSLSGNARSHGSTNALVAGNTLIAVDYPTASAPVYGLVAYDLSTGRRLWSATQPGVEMVTPFAVDGSAVVAAGGTLDSSGNETDPALVRVSLASGKVLSSTPRPTGQEPIGSEIGFYRYAWADGRAYAADWGQEPTGDAPTVFTLSASSRGAGKR
jgi:outer membrane protein assembly factor BamB